MWCGIHCRALFYWSLQVCSTVTVYVYIYILYLSIGLGIWDHWLIYFRCCGRWFGPFRTRGGSHCVGRGPLQWIGTICDWLHSQWVLHPRLYTRWRRRSTMPRWENCIVILLVHVYSHFSPPPSPPPPPSLSAHQHPLLPFSIPFVCWLTTPFLSTRVEWNCCIMEAGVLYVMTTGVTLTLR